jgi:hypothetical protein
MRGMVLSCLPNVSWPLPTLPVLYGGVTTFPGWQWQRNFYSGRSWAIFDTDNGLKKTNSMHKQEKCAFIQQLHTFVLKYSKNVCEYS